MHPHYQAIVDAYREADRSPFHRGTPAEAREMLRTSLAAAPAPAGLPDLATISDETIDGPHGPITLRRYVPHDAAGTCVYFHGGGWVIGDIDQSDPLCRRLSTAASCEVLSVNYRLAPEHPYPQPLDDAYAALLWGAEHRQGPLLVAGESAGGNLAAACAIRARDTGGPALTGQFLAYPVTDANFETSSYRQVDDGGWLLSRADMMWFWDHYCPPTVDRAHPWISPLRADNLADLPPAMICVAELDPLRDEGLMFAERLAAAGVSVTLRRDPDVLHGYLAAVGLVDVATAALTEATAWIATEVRAAAAAGEPSYGDAIAG